MTERVEASFMTLVLEQSDNQEALVLAHLAVARAAVETGKAETAGAAFGRPPELAATFAAAEFGSAADDPVAIGSRRARLDG